MSYSADAFECERVASAGLPSAFAEVEQYGAAELLAEIYAVAAAANRLDARKHALISQLYAVRDRDRHVQVEPDRVYVSEWDEIVAEVGAVLETGRGAASAAIHRSLDIREHPHVFELFADGRIGLTHVRSVLRAGAAIMDADIAAKFDERIAGWLATAIADPAAAVTAHAVSQAAARILLHLDRGAIPEKPPRESPARLSFHARSDGAVDLDAVLPKADAIRLSAVIDEVSDTVCAFDSRTRPERRVAALIALVSGYAGIGCLCGAQSCRFREAQPRYQSVAPDVKALAVIVLNESDFVGPVTDSSLAGSVAPANADAHVATNESDMCGTAARSDAHRTVAATDSELPSEAPESRSDDIDVPGAERSGAVVLCEDADISGPVTAEQARALIAACTTSVATLGARNPETGEVHAYGGSGYRPTKYQRLVMQLIYPTCVFPGCTVPAPKCQADHVSEYDHADPLSGGATTVAGYTSNGVRSPGNLVPLCAFHHRIKTETGWLSDVCDDGAVEWRHPAGGTWLVAPGPASTLLPALAQIRWRVRGAALETCAETDPRHESDPGNVNGGWPVRAGSVSAESSGAESGSAGSEHAGLEAPQTSSAQRASANKPRSRTSAQRRAERRRALRAANRRNRQLRRGRERGSSGVARIDAQATPVGERGQLSERRTGPAHETGAGSVPTGDGSGHRPGSSAYSDTAPAELPPY